MAPATWDGGFVHGSPRIQDAVRGLTRRGAGAVAVLAPTAKQSGLLVTPHRGVSAIFRRALKAGRSQGAIAGRIWHGTGRIAAGKPMVVVAAAAENRRDALLAVESMLNALKGVAERRDA